MARLRSFVLLCSFLPSLLHQGAAVAIPLNSTGPDSTTNSTIRINATFRPRNLDKLRANISAGHSIRPKPAHANQPLFYPSAVPNATAQEIQDARELVAAAHASQAAYNTYQLANPRRNMYGPEDPAASRVKRDDQVPMPTLSVEVQQAVKLVSHVDDSIRHQNGTLLLPISHELPPQYQDQGPTSSFKPSGSPTKRTASDFWMENVDHYWLVFFYSLSTGTYLAWIIPVG